MYGMKVFFILAVILLPSTAHAYIDPGTGGMLLQGLLAAFIAGIIAVKSYWGRIVDFFKKKDGDN